MVLNPGVIPSSYGSKLDPAGVETKIAAKRRNIFHALLTAEIHYTKVKFKTHVPVIFGRAGAIWEILC